MTHFIQTDNEYYKDGRGSVVNCYNCGEAGIFTQMSPQAGLSLLYQMVEVPLEYSCEFLSNFLDSIFVGHNVGIYFGYTNCENKLGDYTVRSRIASCKNDYCVNDGGFQIKSAIWPGLSIYPAGETGDYTLWNISNINTWCSNNYNKYFSNYQNLRYPVWDSNLEYDFQIILETFEIDMETYSPGYICVESVEGKNTQGSIGGSIPGEVSFLPPTIRTDFQYRTISCFSPQIACRGTAGVCSDAQDPTWTTVGSDISSIKKIYSYEDCGRLVSGGTTSDEKSGIPSTVNLVFDPSRGGEYCELCSPTGGCSPYSSNYNPWPYIFPGEWTTIPGLLSDMDGINPKCCTSNVNLEGKKPQCSTGIIEEYECTSSSYKTLKCIDGDVKKSDVKEAAGLCGLNDCSTEVISNIPQDKQLENNNKVIYKIKQNKTIEQTITTYNKLQKSPLSSPKQTTPLPRPEFIGKTKYIEPKALGNYVITVTFAYCKGVPKLC